MMIGQNTGAQSRTYKMIKEGTEGVEIGVWLGDTTVLFAERAKVHAVDPWSADCYTDEQFDKIIGRYSKEYNIEPTREGFQKFYDGVYENVCNRFEGKNVEVHRMTSKEWFEQNTKKDFDWVYVDGDHSFKACLYDLNQAWDVVRSGGVLYGDDYPNKPGVVQAVDSFVYAKNLKLNRFANNQWYIEKK